MPSLQSEVLYLRYEPEITNAIRNELQLHFKRHPRLSLNAFAKRNELSEATLRRLIKGNLKTSPKYHTVLKVLQAISKSSSPRDWIDRYPGVIAQFLEKNTSIISMMEEAEEVSPQGLIEITEDKNAYIAYILAANSSGVSTTRLNRVLGLPGILAMQRLESRGYVKQSSNGRFYSTLSGVSFSNKVFIKNFQRTAEFLHVEDRKVDEPNLFYNLSNSVNLKAYREILKIQVEAGRKIQAILRDPETEGDIPAFALMAVDRFER